jgi:pimeloyl-ACP methyl ester carboxylesterase
VLLNYLRPNIVGDSINHVLSLPSSLTFSFLNPQQSICTNLYPTNPAAVDDLLCGGILRDSIDPGAINVMMAGAKLPVPRTANELLKATFRLGESPDVQDSSIQEAVFEGPVLIAQGVLDPLNDAKDRMERYAALRPDISTAAIQAGHCPHDELHNEVATAITSWKRSLVVSGQKSSLGSRVSSSML